MSLSNKGGADKEISEVHSVQGDGAIVPFFTGPLLAKYICMSTSWGPEVWKSRDGYELILAFKDFTI